VIITTILYLQHAALLGASANRETFLKKRISLPETKRKRCRGGDDDGRGRQKSRNVLASSEPRRGMGSRGGGGIWDNLGKNTAMLRQNFLSPTLTGSGLRKRVSIEKSPTEEGDLCRCACMTISADYDTVSEMNGPACCVKCPFHAPYVRVCAHARSRCAPICEAIEYGSVSVFCRRSYLVC